MLWARGAEGGELVPKGDIAARKAFGALREGRALCMLVDQKMNDGIPVPFFGRDAMTAPALAVLALRYDCAVVPIRMERTKGAHFRMISEPALALPKTGNNEVRPRRADARGQRHRRALGARASRAMAVAAPAVAGLEIRNWGPLKPLVAQGRLA